MLLLTISSWQDFKCFHILFLHNYFSASSLKDNSVLTELRLESCGLTIEGTTQLAEVLKSIPSLSVLDLSFNDVGADTAEHLGIGYHIIYIEICGSSVKKSGDYMWLVTFVLYIHTQPAVSHFHTYILKDLLSHTV